MDLILDRYICEDRGLLYTRRKAPLVTRVLLNDISRYWRTLTIDFLQKQGERDDGWALRNIKLRLSLAEVCLRPKIRPETAIALFETYDTFLGALNDPERRDTLKSCPQEELGKSEVFRDLSRLARRFQDEGVKRLFFEDDPLLRELTIDYGVF